jgi:hypothetical protein
MINSQHRRIATAAAILTLAAGSVAVPRRRALSIPTRCRIAASHSQTHRCTVRYVGLIVNSCDATT